MFRAVADPVIYEAPLGPWRLDEAPPDVVGVEMAAILMHEDGSCHADVQPIPAGPVSTWSAQHKDGRIARCIGLIDLTASLSSSGPCQVFLARHGVPGEPVSNFMLSILDDADAFAFYNKQGAAPRFVAFFVLNTQEQDVWSLVKLDIEDRPPELGGTDENGDNDSVARA